MYVFYSEERIGNRLILSEQEAKHFKVRRIRKNEYFGVIYDGSLFKCKVLREEGKRIMCEIVQEIEVKPLTKRIVLYQCITQDLKTMDLIIRQATELGVSKLIPVLSERSFRRKEALSKRLDKWRRIVVEAMKQSRRAIPMDLGEPIDVNGIEPTMEENILLDNFYEGLKPTEINLKASSFSVIVGPEGGFSEREARLLRKKGFKSVLLEPYTLRTETASIAILSILMNC